MTLKRIQKNDTVIMITGKEKGKTGEVLKVDGNKVLVSGINMATHYVKRDQQKGQEGSLTKKEAFVDVSNVAYFDKESKKPVKIGFKVLSDGKKIRYNKRTKKEVSE